MITLQHNPSLDIATAPNRRAVKWQNKRTTWQDVVNTLAQTERTAETIRQYMTYTKDRQDEIKDVGGFVGGYLREGRRKKGYVEYRQVVCLDADYGGVEVWDAFALLDIAGCMYTTHKHRPEAPRLRIAFPLSRKVNPDEYEAIARVVASWLDIDAFDDTTYQPTRLMYYPSTSKDGEFIFNHTDAPALDADAVLAELPDWRDPTTWPVSSRVKDTVRPAKADKAEDPEEKDGIVGAFCRAYPMYDALAEFLTDQYTPCEELGQDRYSLVGGSTAGGLVVYDNKWAYSHHATDAAGGRLLNAFDLVRLHKFADLDEKAKPDTDVVKLPSYKAMAEFAGKLAPVKKEIIRARRERSTADEYDTLEDQAREAAGADDWVGGLETEGRSSTVKNTIANAVLILNNDEHLKGSFGFNEFEQRETALKALPWDRNVHKYPRPLTDADDAELRLYMERAYDLTSKGAISDALVVTERSNSYHPVRDYLDACEWDGNERLDTLFVDIFGAADTPYTRAVTRKAFCAAVARIYRPGCKFDYVLTLIGRQGQGKSTALKYLGGDWYNESMEVITGKEAMERIQGSWIVELAELERLSKSEVAETKHFISKCEDRFRVAYGKRVEDFPRRCVFFGTTNEEDFLKDVTGNRRFWVVNVKRHNGARKWYDYLTPATVAQLWAEAKHRLAEGETLYLDEEMEETARAIQDRHLETDERSGRIREYLERLLPQNWDALDLPGRRMWLEDPEREGSIRRKHVCILEVWAEGLGKDPDNITRRDSFEISRIMKTLRGWTQGGKAARFRHYGVQKVYERLVTEDVTDDYETVTIGI